MVEDLKLVIRLQELDHQIDELRREIASLPKHISQIEKALDSHTRRLEADRAALSANQRDRKQVELEIQSKEQKISNFKTQMLGAKTNEQYTAFKKEIEFLETEIRKHEDRILERMTESETLERNVRAAEAALNGEKQQVEAEKQRVRACTAADQRKLQELEKERQGVSAGIPPQIHKSYETIRKKRKGLAVTEAVEGRCTGCHMALRLQFYQELRRCDRVMFCESCGRILYYIAPVEVEDLGEAPAVEHEHVESR